MPITINGTGTIIGVSPTGIIATQDLPATGTITNLTTTTVSDGTNSTSATNLVRGACYAASKFNPNNNTVQSSYNISSVTNLTSLSWQINYTNAFPDTNYVLVLTSNEPSGDIYRRPIYILTMATTYTSFNFAGATPIPTIQCVAVFKP